jgi:uncharacterized membrane protein YbhN (UPF0104 family)
MGGGELLKIGVLQSQLELPPASVVAGAFLDRLFDLLGLVVLVAILACTGTALPFRPGPRQTAILAGGMALLALSASFVLLARDRLPPKLGTMLNQALDVLRTLRRPAHAGRLLLAQGLITTLDVTGTYLALQAFPFGPTLPALIALKLSAYLMLSAALPLLPGGAGTLQIACLLALQPSGVSVSGAFAFSLVAQGMGIIVYGIMAAGVAFWPGEKTGIQALRRPGGTA